MKKKILFHNFKRKRKTCLAYDVNLRALGVSEWIFLIFFFWGGGYSPIGFFQLHACSVIISNNNIKLDSEYTFQIIQILLCSIIYISKSIQLVKGDLDLAVTE